MKQMIAMNKVRRGGSLVEMLVVIVVFTVGILTAVQIFPVGLGVLRTNQRTTIATSLARAEMESMKLNVEQVPEAIMPVRYDWNLTGWTASLDLTRNPASGSPDWSRWIVPRSGILEDAAGNQLGPWQLFTGPNMARRVIGEGRTVPAPRFVPTSAGTRFGGVLSLQFAPVFDDPRFTSAFVAYGNDLNKRWEEDLDDVIGEPVRQEFTYFIEESGEQLAMPTGPVRPDITNFARTYRVSATVRYTSGLRLTQVRLFSVGSSNPRVYTDMDLAGIFVEPGLAFERVEPDTVQIARVFDRVPTFLDEATVRANPALIEDAAYQFDVLSLNLGTLIFNPQGVNYRERRRNSRVPMTARVDYDVLDWRNIRDDFRVPTNRPFQQKLILDSIKVAGQQYSDNNAYRGLNFLVQTGSGGTEQRDVVLVDRESGGVFQPNSYRVDKSQGVMTFVDVDNNVTNGLSADIIFTGATVATRVDDVRGRSVRAVYQGVGDVAVQVHKATSQYRITDSTTLGYGQCYVGGSNAFEPNDLTTRIYFPLADAGKKVIVGEINYLDAGGVRRTAREQEFLIRAPGAGDWGAMAFIDVNEKSLGATAFDFSKGYAVRRVRGASVTIRTAWNPTTLNLTGDSAQNQLGLANWLNQTKVTSTESFLMRGEAE